MGAGDRRGPKLVANAPAVMPQSFARTATAPKAKGGMDPRVGDEQEAEKMNEGDGGGGRVAQKAARDPRDCQ